MRKLFLISIALGAFGATLYGYEHQDYLLEKFNEEYTNYFPPYGPVPAVYAARDIKVGDVVTPDALQIRFISYKKIPSHMISKPNEVVGRRPITDISKGDLLGMSDFYIGREIFGGP